MSISHLIDDLRGLDCEILTDSPMSSHTTFRVGGNAELVVFPKTEEALLAAVNAVRAAGLRCIVIGNGSNILVRDCGIEDVVIKTTSLNSEISVTENTIKCSAGASLTKLCLAALENSLTGLEFAYGIPGTVGGAVFMNAGAYGGETKDVLTAVNHISPSGEIERKAADALELGYRTSFYSKNPDFIISSAEFTLKKGDKKEIKAKMDELMSRRKEKQPLEFPSAGSTFKRPRGHFAGALIEECGLKGYRIGGAEVSEKHAGFILNRYGGTATEVLALIEYVKKIVKEKTGVTLEPEVRIIP